jgi:hypothetical protein
MKRAKLLLFLISSLALLLAGCEEPTTTPTAGTPDLTETPGPSATFAVATPTPIPATATPHVVYSMTPNVLTNGDFETWWQNGELCTAVYGEDEVQIVPCGWTPYRCAGCDAWRQGNGNPVDLTMGVPEFGQARCAWGDWDYRCRDGEEAARWFRSFQTYHAGLQQLVEIPDGAVSGQVIAYVQVWATDNGDPPEWGTGGTGRYSRTDRDCYRFDSVDSCQAAAALARQETGRRVTFACHIYESRETCAEQIEDDQDSMYARIRVIFPNGNGTVTSRWYGYGDGIYDNYAPVSFAFDIPEGASTLILSIETVSVWPLANNDTYVDSASLAFRIAEVIEPTATPMPGVTPTPTPVGTSAPTGTPEPTPTREADIEYEGHTVVGFARVLAGPCLIAYGADVVVYSLGRDAQGNAWCALDYDQGVWVHCGYLCGLPSAMGQYPWYPFQQCGQE